MEEQKKILIVEDEEALRKALSERLTKEGYQVMEAGDGEEGLALALQHHPGLVLLDIVMPEMDGVAVLRELRKDEWGKGAEVVVLSNLSDATKVSEVTEYNCSTYLVKSDWHISDLVDRIKQMYP